jgi:hypothetical protein
MVEAVVLTLPVEATMLDTTLDPTRAAKEVEAEAILSVAEAAATEVVEAANLPLAATATVSFPTCLPRLEAAATEAEMISFLMAEAAVEPEAATIPATQLPLLTRSITSTLLSAATTRNNS